jgi:hypothetical protein
MAFRTDLTDTHRALRDALYVQDPVSAETIKMYANPEKYFGESVILNVQCTTFINGKLCGFNGKHFIVEFPETEPPQNSVRLTHFPGRYLCEAEEVWDTIFVDIISRC